MSKITLKYLITGTGRCGTLYAAKLLSNLGFPCGHESIFTYDGLAEERLKGILPITLSECSQRGEKWFIEPIVAESSYMAAPYLHLTDAKVIHIVRDPIKVVNSFCNYIDYFQSQTPSNPYEEFIYRHVKVTKGIPYERACLYYVEWNKMIKSDFFYRIEDEILGFLGKNPILPDKTTNSFKKEGKMFSLRDLPKGSIKNEFIKLGREYGYFMEAERLL